MNITVLTVGSRGDVEPCVALALGLQRAGHDVTLATGTNFNSFVTARGIRFAPIRADYFSAFGTQEGRAEIAANGLQHLFALPAAERDRWRRVVADVWEAARGADGLVYHPMVLGAYDAAEKLRLPTVLLSFMPYFTPTRRFPTPIHPNLLLSGLGNWLTHALARRLFFKKLTFIRNRWRVRTLGLPPRPWYANDCARDGRPLPILYCFSPHVVPVPDDWCRPVEVTGYWSLGSPPDWRPPEGLVSFLEAGPPPVCVGFGSMPNKHPRRVTDVVVAALRQTGQRGVLLAGWGGLAKTGRSETIFALDDAPHRWLFPRVSVVVHHGGAGTTAAGLWAGKPTVVCPFAFDQSFWGKAVHDLGVGPSPVPQSRLTAARLADAIRKATSDDGMRQRAESLGAKIRAEDGVANAVELVGAYLSGRR
jgi:sterol 3beta-glucosyltransferase